jgi:hypothetical protein
MRLLLTSVFVERLRDEVRQAPLREQEIRRVVGLGSHHLAAVGTDLGAQGFAAMFTLTFDGAAYAVCVPLDRLSGRRGTGNEPPEGT